METEPVQPITEEPELQAIVEQLDVVLEKQEYCPFVVIAITKYIYPWERTE